MKITETVTWVSATTFLLTVVYISAVSLAVDVNFIPYISFNDYLKLSVCWLPKHLLAIAIVFVMPALLFNLITGKAINPKDLINLPDKWTTFTKQYRMPLVFIGLTAITLIVLSILFGSRGQLISTGCFSIAIIIWLSLVWYRQEFNFIKQCAGWKQYALTFGPLYLMLVFFSGWTVGKGELQRVDKHPNACIEMISKEPIKRGNVLFVLSQYIVLLEQKTKLVEIIPVSQVRNIIHTPEGKGEKKKNKKNLDETMKKYWELQNEN